MEIELAVDDEALVAPFGLVDRSFDDLVKDVELEKYLAAARNVSELKGRIGSLLQPAGINRFCHTDFTSGHGVVDPIGNYDAKVTDRYVQEGFHIDDFATRHMQLNKKPIFRSVIQDYLDNAPFEHELFRKNRDISKFLTEVGLRNCYNIPIVDGDRYGLFSISVHHGEPRDFIGVVSKNMDFIHSLSAAVDRVGTVKFSKNFHCKKPERLRMCPRPLEILELMAKKDLTGAEAARLLGLHEITINKHIAAAKKALGATTLPGLLMAAIRAGLISIYKDNT